MTKRLLEKNNKIKVILMSATININIFYNYFKKYGNYEDLIFEIKENIYEVKEYYIEDFDENLKKFNIKGINFIENQNEPFFSEDLFEYIKFIIIDIYKQTNEINGILIFLPGINEIRKLENYLNEEFEILKNENLELTKNFPFIKQIKDNIEILILHSELKEIQNNIFKKIKGKRKIILSTNIAETSITIPNITFIIDFCLHNLIQLIKLIY